MSMTWTCYWSSTDKKISVQLATSSETKPWVLPVSQDVTQKDFNGKLKIKKSDRLYIPLNSISEKVANHLKRIAAFKNPEFYSKQAMRISTYNIPRIICRADFTDDYLALPRGCEDAVTTMLESLGVAYEMIDETNHGKPVAVAFKGKERDEQLDAINSLMPYTNGVLAATTAFGKTVTAAALIARKKGKHTRAGTFQSSCSCNGTNALPTFLR